MKKFLMILATAALLAAGCEVKRDGNGFVISTQSQGAVIDGQQTNWDLRPNVSSPLIISPPDAQPMGGMAIPQ